MGYLYIKGLKKLKEGTYTAKLNRTHSGWFRDLVILHSNGAITVSNLEFLQDSALQHTSLVEIFN